MEAGLAKKSAAQQNPLGFFWVKPILN